MSKPIPFTESKYVHRETFTWKLDEHSYIAFTPQGVVYALTLFNACHHAAEWARCAYLIEQPVGVLSSHIRKPDHMFDPCDYGDPYTKKTCLWTGGDFVMPPKRRVEPVNGSAMHMMPPGPDRARLRSKTPAGFAQAVFDANYPRAMSRAS